VDQISTFTYQQTFVDTTSKVTFAKLGACPWARQSRDPRDRKTPITAADLLNDRGVPCFDEREVKHSRGPADRGTKYCGNPHPEYELYLAVEDIDHSRTKTKSPRTNGIVERLHKTMLNEFDRIAFRKKLSTSIAALQPRRMDQKLSGRKAASRPLVFRHAADANLA
jgi:hypothetical protein